jgi:U4/U6 small nuclear ribonucleoprotein PRP4
MLATASFSGAIKLWSIPSSTLTHTFKGHNERVSGVAFHPFSTSTNKGGVDLASGAIDGSCFLWNFDSEYPVAELEGHAQRVSRVAFHPGGRFLGTASFDSTWRLWDIETTTELLLQEGHSRELFAIGFQGDGSLVATGGKDTLGRIWDLRTGRSVMLLTGHIKSLLTLDWSPNGHQLATGSEDNTIRIWDLRGKGGGCVYNIPAHTGLVSQVKYFNNGFFNAQASNDMMDVDKDDDMIKKQLLNGSCLVSSSYDGTCKIWTEGDWKSIKVLSGLEGKLMCCDVSSDAKYIATASYDRTFKLFSAEG